MPWLKQKVGEKWQVFKEGDDKKPVGHMLGEHDSEEEANKQLAALYASEEKKSVENPLIEKPETPEQVESKAFEINGMTLTLEEIMDAAKRNFERNVGGGTDRDSLPDSSFVFPDDRAFPIVIAKDVKDAVSSFGRYKGKHSFEDFKTRLTSLAKRKGFEFSLPEKWDEPTKSLNLDYVFDISEKIIVPEMAVKYTALDEIKGYTFLWGSEKLTDVEREYFTKSTNFWDEKLGKNPRPLTWDHAQDEDFKAVPTIGMINEWGDDEVGRWYVAKLDRAHKFRKAIDKLIEEGVLGTSSDSAPQYVQRVKTGKATWLKEWPWFASALTDVPAEPRMIGSVDVLKSLGVDLPEVPDLEREEMALKARLFKLFV